MDDKTLTALSTTLALFQIQLNALMLLVDRHVAAGTVREDFHRLVSEGVATVGLHWRILWPFAGTAVMNVLSVHRVTFTQTSQR